MSEISHSIAYNLMKARSLPLHYFTRNQIDNNMLKISETFWVITVLFRWADTRGHVARTCRSDMLQGQKTCLVHTEATRSRDE